MRSGPSPLIALFIFCMAGGVGGYALNRTDSMPPRVLITLESSAPIETQLFYDTGKGFNENDSSRKVLYQVNVPVTLNFDIPGPKLNGLRFDPSRSPARINISEIIIKYQKEKTFAVPLDSLKAAKDIKSLRYDGRALTVETTGTARDPILLFTRIGQAPKPSIMRTILHVAAGAIITLGMAFFILWVYRNSLDPKEFST
jgi:hypothetical protein